MQRAASWLFQRLHVGGRDILEYDIFSMVGAFYEIHRLINRITLKTLDADMDQSVPFVLQLRSIV